MKTKNSTQTTATRTKNTNPGRMTLLLPEDVIRASKACCERCGITMDQLVQAAMVMELVRG